MSNRKKAIVLLSGGQDSTTCLYWAKQRFDDVITIGFNYGQKHINELKQAEIIADEAKVPFIIIDIQGILRGSALTDHTLDINAPHKNNADLPSSFTAGRNMLFLTIASSFGYDKQIYDIVTGVCQTDYSGYPDCRRVFIDSMQATLTLAMSSQGQEFRIHTPLMYLTKAETWKLAKQLDIVEIIRTKTLTDYNGNNKMNDWGMGSEDNPASILRAKGYREAKQKGWI